MIARRDFKPKYPGLFFPNAGQYAENFAAALADANEWIVRESVDVMNVETIVYGGNTVPFIRIWYRSASDKPHPTPEV